MRRTLSLVVGFLVPLAAVAEPGPAPREVRFDRDGDRLPDGAVARLGSRRFRDPGADRLFVFDSGKVVACFDGPTVRWWDLKTGRYLRGWAAPGGGRAWFSPDGRVGAVEAGDRLEVWDAWNDRRLRTFEVDPSRRVVAAISPDGRTVAVGTSDWDKAPGRLRVWDVATGAECLVLDLEYYAESLHFADAGRLLIVLPVDGRAVAWDLGRGVVRWRLDDGDRFVLDRRGRWFAAEVGQDSKLVFHDATTGRPVADRGSLPRYASTSNLSDISPNGRTLLLNGLEDGCLWDVGRSAAANQERQFSMDPDSPRPSAGAFFPDGRRAVLGVNCRLEVFDVDEGKRMTRRPGRVGPARGGPAVELVGR